MQCEIIKNKPRQNGRNPGFLQCISLAFLCRVVRVRSDSDELVGSQSPAHHEHDVVVVVVGQCNVGRMDSCISLAFPRRVWPMEQPTVFIFEIPATSYRYAPDLVASEPVLLRQRHKEVVGC